MFTFFCSGRGGASIYGKEFADEITNELKHTGEDINGVKGVNSKFNMNIFFICLDIKISFLSVICMTGICRKVS